MYALSYLHSCPDLHQCNRFHGNQGRKTGSGRLRNVLSSGIQPEGIQAYSVDPMHLLMNMVSLYNVGSFVESYFGRGRMLVIYFVSLILGKLLSMYIRHSNHDDYTVSIGASGAISGLLGAYFLVILHYYGFGGISYLSRPLISLVMISIMPGVDGTSHFSCMAAGMAVTWLFFLF